MKIVTSGHSFEDAVRQILQLFFDLNSDFEAESTLQIEENLYIAKAKVTLGEKSAEGEIKATLISPEKREVSDLIKKSVFFACKKLSDMPTPWGISTGIRPAKTARMMLDENKTDEEILSYMEDEFFITPKKARLSLDVAKSEHKLLSNRAENTVSLYLGVPFCPTRCAYCSFISQAVKHNQKFIKPYVDALLKEIEATAQMAESFGYKAETIYFGGGTPTTLSPEDLDILIKRVKNCFDVSLLREFTVEAGRPDTFSDEMLAVLWDNGVNRISINPQTMNQKTLDKIGRRHSVEDTIRAFEMAKKYDFSINADLIAGLPEESTEDFRKTVSEVCSLSPQAVTVHTMYLKRAARLISDFEKLRFAKDMDSMVQLSYDYLTGNGYEPYYLYKQKNTLGNLENVGFAQKCHESLYNIFIMEEIQTILAMGGGASTKMVKGDRIERVFNPKEAADYINRIDEIIEKKKKALEFFEVKEMITFTYENEKITIKESTTIGAFVEEQGFASSVLACKIGGKIVAEDYVIKANDIIEPLTISSDEGYLIYKESLILVLLHAVEMTEGANAVFVRQSVNKSTYFEVDTDKDKVALAKELKDTMTKIIEDDTDFRSVKLSKAQAATLFTENGEKERAEEISALPAEYITVCRTAKRYHLTYQPVAYSVRALAVFDIQPFDDGFLLKYPTNYTIDSIPTIKSGVKVHNAIEDYRDWISTVGIDNIFSLNKTIRENRVGEFVNMAEGLHEKKISRIADKIKESPQIKIILIAGPSSSGKTSFANRLCLHLKINHINPVVISLDDYYVDFDRMPRDEKGEMDFECVESIDYELFNEHLALLAEGKSVTLPKFDFKTKKRVEGNTVTLKDNQIIIAEGIHALNELLTSRVARENKYKIYLSCLTSLCLDEYNAFSPTDNRLLRRMIRDAEHRNTTAEETFGMWKSVRRGEQKYIFPFESEADEVFNSSLVYELAVIKKPALELLSSIGENSPHYSRARRLIKLLSYFEEFDPYPIPPTSIIREFIGGSTIVH